jgi:hypothetical protein
MFPESLITSESGGNWQAQNAVTGAGGLTGHFGRLQFGRARLQDAMRAGVLPQGTTPQQFMADPALQQAVEQWHFADIDAQAQRLGLDRYLGQNVGGATITQDAIRAMAHLGGIGGAQRFLESGGQYNPADAYGTSLLDYATQHGGGNTQMAQPQGLLGTVSTMGAPERPPSIWDKLAGVPVLGGLADPDKRAQIAIALQGMSVNPNPGYVATLQRGIDNRAEERKTNQTIAWLQSIGRGDLAEAVLAGGLGIGDAAAVAMTPAQATEQARASVILQDGTTIQSTDTGVRVYSPTGGELTGQAAADAIAQARSQEVADQRAVYGARREGTLGADINLGGDAAYVAAEGTAAGRIAGERQGAASTQIANADIALQGIDGIMNHPALGGSFLDGGTGASSYFNALPGTPGYDFQNRVKQLASGAFLTAIQQLQGMGALSNAEGQTATAALARLDTGLSQQDFIAALNDYKAIVEAGRARAMQMQDGGIATTPLPATPPSSAEIQSLLDKYAPVN